MVKMNFKIGDLSIITPNTKIQGDIKNAIVKKFDNTLLKKRIDNLNIELANFFYLKFLKSDTFISMLIGDLRGEFGFSDSYLNNIEDICAAISAVYLDYKVLKGKDFLKIIIGVHDKNDIDYEEVGVFTTEKGEKIYWLYWLLTQGTTPVVPGYDVYPIQGAGRSHMAVMIKNDITSYSVDAQYAGTEEDNWVTRILDENKEEFLSIIKKNFHGT
jgi:hypothetical protein